MNYVIHGLHLLCTIGKKEGISTGIAWQKAFWNWLENQDEAILLPLSTNAQRAGWIASWQLANCTRIKTYKADTKDYRVAQDILKLIMYEGYAPFTFDSCDLIDIPSSEEEHFPLLVTHVPMITP
jgi:hypothetical protein